MHLRHSFGRIRHGDLVTMILNSSAYSVERVGSSFTEFNILPIENLGLSIILGVYYVLKQHQ